MSHRNERTRIHSSKRFGNSSKSLAAGDYDNDVGKSSQGPASRSNNTPEDFRGKDQDVRISKLARTMARLESEEIFSKACDQIEDLLKISEHRRYVLKSFSCLIVPFGEIFKGFPGLAWMKAGTIRYAKFFSKIAEVMDSHSQSNRLFQWLIEFIDRKSHGTRVSETSFAVQDVILQLIPFLNQRATVSLVTQILEVIEQSTHTDIFKILCSLFVSGVLHNASTKMANITEFVDIVIGWLMEENDDDELYGFCTEILQNLNPFFSKNPSFLATLITQLLEDMTCIIKELEDPKMPPGDVQTRLVRNTTISRIFKSLVSIDGISDKNFLQESCEVLVSNLSKSLKLASPSNQDIFISFISQTNDCISDCSGVDGPNIRQFFQAQLTMLIEDNIWRQWPKSFISSFFHGLTVWIDSVAPLSAVQNQSTEEIVDICSLVLDLIDKINLVASPEDQFMIVGMVHSILRTRNVNMLQKAYTWIVRKVQVNDDCPDVPSEDIVYYVLACLSDIAINKGNAILVLWTLNPPIFDFLMMLLTKPNCSRLNTCITNMLKAHCVSHSHFVSSIVSVNSYSSESPGTRFLPALMTFWTQQLSDQRFPQDQWTFEWVVEFLKGSASYASVLTQRQPEFYKKVISVICSKPSLMDKAPSVLEYMCQDPNYNQSNIIMDAIQDNCIHILTSAKVNDEMKWAYKNLLNILPNLIVYEPCFDCESTENISPAGAVSNSLLLTANQFNSFLTSLFTVTQNIKQSDQCQIDPVKTVEAAVEYLLRAKLKTPLGKPQEFFGQLQVMLKKHKMLKLSQDHPLPLWKLRFVFELERKLILWIHGSSMLQTNVPEHIRSFFLTNKTPCTEWLKRMRPEVIEASLAVQDNYTVYLYASLSADNYKVKTALLNMRDGESLKGMQDLAAFYYLEGNFEEALRYLAIQDNSVESSEPEVKDPFKEIIQKRSESVLSAACQSLEYWSDTEPERPENCIECLISPSYKFPTSILDLQLKAEEKSSIYILDSTAEELKLLTLLKIGEWMKNAIMISSAERDRFESKKARSLLEHGNLDFARNWLLKRNINVSIVDELRPILTFAHLPRDYIEFIADVFYAENNFYISALMYSAISDILPPIDNHSDLDQIANFYRKFAIKIDETEEFCDGVMGRPPMILTSQSHASFVEPLFEKAVEYAPNNKNIWFDFANYMYQLALDEEIDCDDVEATNRIKITTVECYTNVLKTNKISGAEDSKKTSKQKVYTSITRLLRLHAQGYEFIPQDAISSDEWLDLLPELILYENLRPYLAKRFPQQCSLHLAPYDNDIENNKKSCKRRGVFDPCSYSFTEVNDEPINISVPTRFLCCNPKEEGESSKPSKEGTVFLGRENLNISPGVKLMLKELNRIGTCRDEFWSWSLQKVVFDWTKRLSSLKKDLTKEFHVGKLKAYLEPMLNYVQSIWDDTKVCETPAELSFYNRHNEIISSVLTELTSCETVESVALAFNRLLTHVESFESYYISRLALSSLSPRLSSSNFSDSEDPISLPGMPLGVFITSVAPVVTALATKTKPKKLMFRCSDGKTREYLVKGNENLNVDAGVMQLLKLTGEFVNCATRTYSITPLGKRGGLIQIVEGAMPLFVLYKKYLQRKNCVERTSEMFWRRLNAMGCTDRSNPALLKLVFETLVKETPNDLISSELLLCAKSPETWYKCVRSFTKDCAFGSAFGYLLGLGDRHLDNILINLNQGHLVHVDFSIIFGKGTTLRIPEKVPFRLTQNITGALQYPGLPGPFSVYLEDFLLSFQKHQEIALFCLNSIAVAYHLTEDSSVDGEKILTSELKSTVILLKHRLLSAAEVTPTIKKETLELSAEHQQAVKDIESGNSELVACSNKLEGLTVALSVLKDKQTDLMGLRALRARCELIKVKEELVKGASRLREKLERVRGDYQECLPFIDEIESFDFNTLLIVLSCAYEENLNVTNEEQKEKAKTHLADVLLGISEAKECSKFVTELGWLSKRYPFSNHLFSRILNSTSVALDTSMENELCFKLANVPEGHTNATVISAWSVLSKELDKSIGEVNSLRTLIIKQGITDLTQEICLWESRSANIEETLSRFTSNYSESDFELLLKFALPILEQSLPILDQSLENPKVNYDFVARLLLLTRNSVTFQIPSTISDILEVLLGLHIQGRELLSEFVTGDYTNFLRAGYSVVASVAEVLNSLNVDQQVVFECYSGPELMILWNKAVEELRVNVEQYDKYLQGENPLWEGSTADLVTCILAPITNFTLPLTKSCQAAIVSTARTILATNVRLLGGTPYSTDPLYRLLSDFQKAQQRLRFLKDLNDGLKGCEATHSWLKGEKDRFEWAHMSLLPTNEPLTKKRTSVLKHIKSGIRNLIARLGKPNDWNLYFDSIAGGAFENFRDYAKTLLKVAQGLYIFENLRFNPAVRQDFQELLDKNPFPVDGPMDDRETEAEKVLSLCAESAGLKRSQITEDDVTWANSMEKIISSQLQKQVHIKINLSDDSTRLTRNQSIAALKLMKKLNRWRRILANLAPLIQFVCANAFPSEEVRKFKEIVGNEWRNSIHFWSHSKVEQLVTQWQKYEIYFGYTEAVLSRLVEIIPRMTDLATANNLIADVGSFRDPSVEIIDYGKVEGTIKTVRDRITGFNATTSVEKLISEATRIDSLAQMYEGWTAWV